MSRFVRLFSFTLVFSLLSATLVFADYTEGPVSGGGSITGKVAFKGAQPPPATFAFAKFPQADFCAKADSDGKGNRIRQDVKVKGGGLADVVVYIEKIEKGKAFKATNTEVISDTCRFLVQGGPSKAVGVVIKKKGEVKVTNTDADPSDPKTVEGVLHNPHAYDMKGALSVTIFNKPVPKKGESIAEKIKATWFKKEDSFMKIECDQHNYMNVWMLPTDNPYYAIVNDDGTFSIDEVPPGKYEIKAFHPQLGFQKVSVDVPSGGKATANFEYAAK